MDQSDVAKLARAARRPGDRPPAAPFAQALAVGTLAGYSFKVGDRVVDPVTGQGGIVAYVAARIVQVGTAGDR